MKRNIFALCIILVFTNISCTSNNISSEYKPDNIEANKFIEGYDEKIKTNGNTIVLPGGVDQSFALHDEILYGWEDELGDNCSNLIDENRVEMMRNVAEFQFQEDMFNDYHYNSGGYAMLYAKKTDNTLWIRGYFSGVMETVEEVESINHNYKKFTKVMDGIKTFYKKPGPGLYVIKEDDSLWYWNKWGSIWENKKQDDFFKVMDDVSEVSVGGCRDYVIKKDGSLWAINIGDRLSEQTSHFYDEDLEKVLDNILTCKVVYSYTSSYHIVYAIDNENKLWTWGITYLDGTIQINKKPILSMENVKSIEFYSDTENVSTEQYVVKTDNSIWLICVDGKIITPKLVVENAEKILISYTNGGSISLFVINDKGQLWNFKGPKLKKEFISANVIDIGASSWEKEIWIKNEKNQLVNVGNGKVYLENLKEIASNPYGKIFALTSEKIYELTKKEIREVLVF